MMLTSAICTGKNELWRGCHPTCYDMLNWIKISVTDYFVILGSIHGAKWNRLICKQNFSLSWNQLVDDIYQQKAWQSTYFLPKIYGSLTNAEKSANFKWNTVHNKLCSEMSAVCATPAWLCTKAPNSLSPPPALSPPKITTTYPSMTTAHKTTWLTRIFQITLPINNDSRCFWPIRYKPPPHFYCQVFPLIIADHPSFNFFSDL